MADAYRDRYGIDPPPAVLSSMAQHATLTTRPAKRDTDPSYALDTWEQAAREQGHVLADLPKRVLGHRPTSRHTENAASSNELVGVLLERLATSGRASSPATTSSGRRWMRSLLERGRQRSCDARPNTSPNWPPRRLRC